ncbi:copper homeostasis protein CutC [Oerskovia flava]|uniref:copper homeostasis protein CutC n=1 Tax=Oerskovia flava TaxID=2986422 RepID=UPI00223EA5D3|nr:copper homeostasis protein CutC [Oerskovia sp. JB1-3-2]
MALELAVQDPAGAQVATEVGALRVELCSALGATGGITPSMGLIEATLAAADAGVEVHPLVRPRPGGFVYSAAELEIQVRDVKAAVAAGVHGVVVGALTPDGLVDEGAVRALVAAADGREVTFHRAIDVVAGEAAVVTALDLLVELGVTRVLTSGGAARSIDGLERLRLMAQHADGRIQVMAGGGVRIEDVPDLVAAGVDAIHLSAKATVADDGGPGGGGDDGYEVTDPRVAFAAATALADAGVAAGSQPV